MKSNNDPYKTLADAVKLVENARIEVIKDCVNEIRKIKKIDVLILKRENVIAGKPAFAILVPQNFYITKRFRFCVSKIERKLFDLPMIVAVEKLENRSYQFDSPKWQELKL